MVTSEFVFFFKSTLFYELRITTGFRNLAAFEVINDVTSTWYTANCFQRFQDLEEFNRINDQNDSEGISGIAVP